jgi:FkbM family methyltransferase
MIPNAQLPEWAQIWDRDFDAHCQNIAARALPHLLPHGVHAVYVDAGANTGNAAAHVLRGCPGVTMVLFEPVTRDYDVIATRFSDESTVTSWRVALGEHPDTAIIECRTCNPGSNVIVHPACRVTPDSAFEVITVQTLDSFALPRIDFLKIDVEYHEAYLLRGAHETIQRTMPVMLIETLYETEERWADRVEQFEWLLSLGYTTDRPYTDALTEMVDILFVPAGR